MGRQDTERRQTKHKRKNYKDEQNGPHQKPGGGVNPGARLISVIYEPSITVGLCSILVLYFSALLVVVTQIGLSNKLAIIGLSLQLDADLKFHFLKQNQTKI